jgi:phosphoglycolate phosphatase-like HAD superfamily hydrolase
VAASKTELLEMNLPKKRFHPRMQAAIFDVEGTLVDCVPQTLESWREALAHFGFDFSTQRLHAFFGMDGGDMLDALLPRRKAGLKKSILKEQGERYRRKFLSGVTPFRDIKPLFTEIKRNGWRIALATSCQPDELRYYDSILNVFALADAVACGADAKRGKPHPDLYLIALQRLGLRGEQALAVGDTPYDARAAAQAGVAETAGTLTGGFSAEALRAAGFSLVIDTAADLLAVLAQEILQQSE